MQLNYHATVLLTTPLNSKLNTEANADISIYRNFVLLNGWQHSDFTTYPVDSISLFPTFPYFPVLNFSPCLHTLLHPVTDSLAFVRSPRFSFPLPIPDHPPISETFPQMNSSQHFNETNPSTTRMHGIGRQSPSPASKIPNDARARLPQVGVHPDTQTREELSISRARAHEATSSFYRAPVFSLSLSLSWYPGYLL